MMADNTRINSQSDSQLYDYDIYDHAGQVDADSDFWFRLRGQSLNPMVDAVTPLLGMVARIRQLTEYTGVPALYQQVVMEIQAIEQELVTLQYENAVILSFRYILCTFIDEAVMKHEWGSHSDWSANSLLVHFHKETWGGEKVFTLLNRLQEDPVRYRDILEFIYLCLCAGFEGRYQVVSQGRGELMAVIRRLYHLLYAETEQRSAIVHLDMGRKSADYRLSRQLSLPGIFVILCLVLAGAFGLYRHHLDDQTQHVLQQLSLLLNKGE